jgi:two-component system response regulator
MDFQPSSKNSEFTILMVDDDIDDQNFVKMAVNKFSSGIKINFVDNGMLAIDFLNRQENPNLIILDLNMPQKNGKEVLNYIKTNDKLKQIPVLIYTTTNSPEEINKVYRLGANSFLTKPRDFKDVTSAIGLICSYWSNTMSLPNNDYK